MKNKYRLNIIGLPVMAVALSVAANAGTAETPVAAPESAGCLDWVKVSGYAAIAYTFTDDGTETFADGGSPKDAVKVGFEGTQGPVSGYVSLFYTPGVDGTVAGILDAYASYAFGDFKITGGKYLSYLGYEAFDAVNMTQITYAAGVTGTIPAYHNGVKIDYSTDTLGAGLSISDSINSGNGFYSGDEEFSDDQGYEAYVTYKGIDKLTLWGGIGYENTDGATEDWITYDFWASYAMSDKLTLAGEIAYHEDPENEGLSGILLAQYAFTESLSLVTRFGIAENYGADNTYSYTLAPTYKFCENFLVRAELTFADTETVDSDDVFSGIQAIAKF
jgi:hypothetical protein